jgi:hypothetical protein
LACGHAATPNGAVGGARIRQERPLQIKQRQIERLLTERETRFVVGAGVCGRSASRRAEQRA